MVYSENERGFLKLFNKIKNYFQKSLERKKRRLEYKLSFKNKFEISPFYSTDYQNPSDIDLITVSFNSPKLIDYQIRMFKKFLKGNFRHIICDNSTKKEAAEEIKEICTKYDVSYIRVQDRKTPNGYSNSHAIALNWIWKNVARKRENNFAFLDHDIFPIEPIEPFEYVKDHPVFGRYVTVPSGKWYMWAGFSFFNFKTVQNLPLNFHRYKKFGFISVHGKNWMDTGSANWNCLYSKIDKSRLKQYTDGFFDFVTGERTDWGAENFAHYLDGKNWFHIFDGGNRLDTEGDRIKRIYSLLDKMLL